MTGALFILFPPRGSLDLWPTVLLLALGALALLAFLPAQWFSATPWRLALTELGLQLPATRSPQPWLTFESSCLLWLGLAWTYYLFAFEWHRAVREKVWDVFCFAILCFAAVLAIAYAINKHVPIWPDVRDFGFFPNRNQTSNVLGLGGVMIYANAFQRLQRGKQSGWFWLCSLALVCWALILNYSRAGIILFFGGALLWNAWWWLSAKERPKPILAFAPLALLLGLLIVAGGETLLRFTKESADVLSTRNARLSIFRDALQLFQQSPALGTGLGNFRALFSSHRDFSFSTSEAIHPESDWLWVAVEMGIFAPLILLALVGWWLRGCFPFTSGTWRAMRMAALICGCAFVVHGFFDVSAHRVGALWPTLFLASTAMRPQDRHERPATTALLFRGLGLFFVAVGAWCFASIAGARVPPTTASLQRLVGETDAADDKHDYKTALAAVSQALKISPLNWELYFKRGFAEAVTYRPRAETLRDFAAARYLLPNWPELYLKEGQAWLGVGEADLAFDVWREGMERLRGEAPRLYERIFEVIKSNADWVDRWRNLGHANEECLLIYLGSADRVGFAIELDRLLAQDRQLHSFAPGQLNSLFAAWYLKGDKLALAQALRENADWQKIGWRTLARIYADYQDYRQAYETVRRFRSPPQAPVTNAAEPISTLQLRFRSNPTLEEGLVLYSALMREGSIDAAIATLESLNAARRNPAYLLSMKADLHARKGEWEKAWNALQQSDLKEH